MGIKQTCIIAPTNPITFFANWLLENHGELRQSSHQDQAQGLNMRPKGHHADVDSTAHQGYVRRIDQDVIPPHESNLQFRAQEDNKGHPKTKNRAANRKDGNKPALGNERRMITNSQLHDQGRQQSRMLTEKAELPLEDDQLVINSIQQAIHAQREMMNIGLRDSGESSSHPHSIKQLHVEASQQNEDENRAISVAAMPPQDAHSRHEYQKSGVSKAKSAALRLQDEQK